jgi:hypothetical protein
MENTVLFVFWVYVCRPTARPVCSSTKAQQANIYCHENNNKKSGVLILWSPNSVILSINGFVLAYKSGLQSCVSIFCCYLICFGTMLIFMPVIYVRVNCAIPAIVQLPRELCNCLGNCAIP